jgi:S1-C subfamily serine protease
LQSLSITNTRFSVAALLKYRKERPSTQIFARGNAMLGIHADTSGSPCILTSLYPGSGAEAAGLQAGDQVEKIDGHEISDFGDLTIAVYAHDPGDKLQVEFIRAGETKTAAVELKPRAVLEAPRR